MNKNRRWLVKFCWSWIILISVVTIAHALYRSWLIAETVSGNEVQNLLNPNQPNDLDYAQHLYISYLHLIPGIVIYLLGPIQFIESIRKKWRNAHRLSGFLFVVSVIVSGLASIFMAMSFPAGGTSETASSIMFSTTMIFCVCRALYLIRTRRASLHREWMIRGYMIALGPGTMHFIIPLFIQLGGKSIGEALSLSLWIGFTIHLILAEVWIRSTSYRPEPRRQNTTISAVEEIFPASQLRYEISV